MQNDLSDNPVDFRGFGGLLVVASITVYCSLLAEQLGIDKGWGFGASFVYICLAGVIAFRGIPYLYAALMYFERPTPPQLLQQIRGGIRSLFEWSNPFKYLRNRKRIDRKVLPATSVIAVIIIYFIGSVAVQATAQVEHWGDGLMRNHNSETIAVLVICWLFMNIANRVNEVILSFLGVLAVASVSALILHDQTIQAFVTIGAVWPHLAYTLHCRRTKFERESVLTVSTGEKNVK